VSPATTREDSLADLVAPLRARPEAAAILCDIDGTLAPIVGDPGAAEVPPDARQALAALASRYALVGCVTGRRATAARMMVGLDELHYAGNHGLEILRPGELEPRVDPGLGRRAGAARQFVDRLDLRVLEEIGMRIEDKGPIQAIHWRGAPDDRLAAKRAQEIAALVERDGLVPHLGRKVLEVRPVAEVHKGSAVRALLRGAPQVRAALFGGDDTTDLDAFAALRALRDAGALDLAICVGVESPEAPDRLAGLTDAMVSGPGGFQHLLAMLAGTVDQTG